MTEMETSKTTD